MSEFSIFKEKGEEWESAGEEDTDVLERHRLSYYCLFYRMEKDGAITILPKWVIPSSINFIH